MTLRAALLHQADSCAALGSPFTARLLRLTADRLRPGMPVADRMLTWQGDLGPGGQSVPLRFAGALHGLVLSGEAPDLAAAYPPHDPTDDALWQAVSGALTAQEDRLQRWLDSAPQTNEVRRSAPLIAAGHWLSARYGLPLIVSEIGASAGLNLMWDRFALALPDGRRGPRDAALVLDPDWRGDLPPLAAPRIADRRGVDLNPLDPANPADALRLRAYIWPDQPDRLARTEAAIAAARAPVDRADALDWLGPRLARQYPGHLHLIYHTIAWQYLPAQAQAKGNAIIDAAGARASAEAPLARFAMEADGMTPGAALTLQLWPEGQVLSMGRVDFHGRWVDWQSGTAEGSA
ncbi:DUF2332 domain-containing protein [Actibacterium sp. D379-3]